MDKSENVMKSDVKTDKNIEMKDNENVEIHKKI